MRIACCACEPKPHFRLRWDGNSALVDRDFAMVVEPYCHADLTEWAVRLRIHPGTPDEKELYSWRGPAQDVDRKVAHAKHFAERQVREHYPDAYRRLLRTT